MHFDNVGELVAMAGHGPYVWSAYLVTLLVMAWLVVSPLRRKRRLQGNLGRRRPAGDRDSGKPEEGRT